MRIDELDEYQGITSEMLGVWLDAHGWDKKPHFAFQLSAPTKLMGYSYTKSDYFVGTGMEIVSVLESIATCEKGGIQVLLRELNPRMRKGMPSQMALAAHLHWLVRDTETGELELYRVEGGHLYSMSVYRGGALTPDANALPDFGTWMEFWPCDEHGNKVRWPTDEHGNML